MEIRTAKSVLAIIPARSGSKGIPHKNIKLFQGKPLIAHSIEHALKSKLVSRVIVSTDSPQYVKVALDYGAEVPFLRPVEIAQDQSTDLEVFVHALDWLRANENYIPEICVHLRPTYPIRDPKDIDAIIQILLAHEDIDSVRTVSLAPETPYKMWFRNESGMLSPVINSEIKEAYNLPRQELPAVYLQNACIDAFRTKVVTDYLSMTGKKIYGYVMGENYDIDTQAQFNAVSVQFDNINKAGRAGHRLEGSRIFCFDIDGVIAAIVPDNNYSLATPLVENVSLVNKLYEAGHKIILFTARGSATGIDWVEVTNKQMTAWDVKHHELLFKKPAADYYIDDKLIKIDDLRILMQNNI